MNRLSRCASTAALALLLAATPAAAISTTANRDRPETGGGGSGWLTVLVDWAADWLGGEEDRPAADDGEPPAGTEGDSGPHWDPGG